MTDGAVHDLLIRAGLALSECDLFFRESDGEEEILDLLAEFRRCCDAAEQRINTAAEREAAATISVLRVMAATYALRHCVHFEVNCDFDDDDGTLLNGLTEHDSSGLSRRLAEDAVHAARSSLAADPADALVPLYLGHALTWLGDRDGAVEAYAEALRRDAADPCARSALKYLDAAPDDVEPSPDGMSHGRYGFALLREFFWVTNNEGEYRFLLFGSIGDARSYAARDTGEGEWEDEEGWEEENDGLLLQIHQPGRPIAEYDLTGRAQSDPEGGPARINWSGIPVAEPLTNPLPPGRPLRTRGRNCFHGSVL